MCWDPLPRTLGTRAGSYGDVRRRTPVIGSVHREGVGSRVDRSRTPVRIRETVVVNTFAIETEVMHRRREWERAVAAEARATQARSRHRGGGTGRTARRLLAVMRTFAKPQFSRTAASTTAVQGMAPVERLQSGGGLVQWRPGCLADEDLTARPALNRSA